jgi:hypothetical protein
LNEQSSQVDHDEESQEADESAQQEPEEKQEKKMGTFKTFVLALMCWGITFPSLFMLFDMSNAVFGGGDGYVPGKLVQEVIGGVLIFAINAFFSLPLLLALGLTAKFCVIVVKDW